MFILCKGKIAHTPYEMPFTNQKVYSIEELCYEVYHNIYTINEDFFQDSLADWLEHEIECRALADKIRSMLKGKPKLKDLVVTILCGCDYYREAEIRKLIQIMDDIESLPIYKKKKIKADNYLRAGCYGRSLTEYRKLLHGSFAVNFTPEEYGDLLHNQGIAHFYISSFDEAKNDFKEAYSRNHKINSLKHFLWILLMEEKEKEFEEEAVAIGLPQNVIESVRKEYRQAYQSVVVTPDQPDDLERYKKQFIEGYVS